jgi:hypothetical protein
MGQLSTADCRGNGRRPNLLRTSALPHLFRHSPCGACRIPVPASDHAENGPYNTGNAPGISADRRSCTPAGLHKTVRAEMTVPEVVDWPSGSGGRADPAGERRPVTGLPGARVVLGSFFRRIGRAACIVWPAPEFVRGPDARQGPGP